jgi:type VI secretion system secreted protein VgrG
MSLARVAIAKSPLGDALVLRAMNGHEELGRPFRYDLDLVAADPDLDFGAVLGQTMTVQLELPDESTREFSGHITEFSLIGGSGQSVMYRAVLSPWLQLLAYRSNCRIFQRQSVPDVVKQVFRDHGFSDFEERLTDTYRTWEYLVQYRESDFAFVSRILEQEGIYYYVKHSGGVHVVVLCDSHSAHEPLPGYEKIPFFPPGERQRERDHIDAWRLTQRIKPGSVAGTDFDFTRPRSSLLAQRTEPAEVAGASYEDFDYPGEYLKSDEGEKEVRVRLEAHHAEREVVQAGGNAAGISVGASFTLADFPRADQNKEYLVVSASYQIEVNADESGIAAGGAVFRCEFTAIDAARAYRPARSTPKPLVEGPQTAIVVGPSGEEIFTDEYGRVKVKFHWDRLSTGDENSSCWVRVAQLWAGTNFGGIHIPRIGQEVIVDFLEGDPDRPIITGRVYNFDNQVPYELPANQTQSGIKSQSSKGGATSNFNELRFEDKLGSEHVYLQAEKDLIILVKNDEQREVGANRSAEIGVDDSESVGGSQSVSIGANQSIEVSVARSISAASESITVGTRTKGVATNESTTIGGSRSETVGRSETVSIGKDQILTVGGKRSQSVDKDDTLSVAGQRKQTITKDDQLQVGKRLVITAADEITLETGSAKLIMKKNGDILLKGKNVQVEGSGKINVKASSDVVLKGSKVSSN